MTNALLGYIIGKYYSDTGCFADLNELFAKGISLDDFRTPEVERFLAIQQFVARQDVTTRKPFAAIQIWLGDLFVNLPEEDLPFYFLPLAYLPGATLEEVLQLTADLLTSLTKNKQVEDQVMCLVGAIKWSLTTCCSFSPFINRCFPKVDADRSSSFNLMGEVLAAYRGLSLSSNVYSEVTSLYYLKQACTDRSHAALRCALVYALTELSAVGTYHPSEVLGAEQTDQAAPNYSPRIHEDFSKPFPLKPRLTSSIDAHIIDGYFRLDRYIAWQMKPKKEPLLEMAILGDENGPDREVLRFWNFCDKHLDWEHLTHELDDYFGLRPFLRVDWRSKLVRHEIQWNRRRVAFLLNNKRCLSFVPDSKKKVFVLDKSEAKDAGISRFQFTPRPAIKVLEDFTDKLMDDN